MGNKQKFQRKNIEKIQGFKDITLLIYIPFQKTWEFY